MTLRTTISEDPVPAASIPALPAGAGLPWWIVCERSGRWAAALRRTPAAAGIRLQETRSLDHAWEALSARPSSFLVAELTATNLKTLVERLANMGRDYPWARVAVVAGRPLAACEGLLREAGAVWFTASPRDVQPIAAIARRHLQTAPRPAQGLAERTWASLPWGS